MTIPAINKQIEEAFERHSLWRYIGHECGKQFDLKYIENYVFDNKIFIQMKIG